MFWDKYTDEDDKRMSYQRILKILQESRESAATLDANTARRFFHGNMNSKLAQKIFTYRKRGITHLCKQDATIAQKWRDLLAKRPDIQSQWEAIEQAPGSGEDFPEEVGI